LDEKVLLGLFLLVLCTAGFSWTVLEDYSNVEYVYYKTTGFDDDVEGINENIYGVKIELTKQGYKVTNETIYDMLPMQYWILQHYLDSQLHLVCIQCLIL
jgi:hypothetical protein